MVMSSAAIVSPLLLDAAGSTAAGKTTETKGTETGIAAKGTKIYYIGKECVGCQVCRTFCPAQAIRFGDCRNEIDPAVFVETIEEYNKLIETGKSRGFDGQGGMRGQSLKPIKTPPFYAIYGLSLPGLLFPSFKGDINNYASFRFRDGNSRRVQ
jgi:ferredoxin